MENKSKLFVSIAALAVLALTFTGCRKDNDEKLDADITSTTDNSFAESNYNEVQSIADQAIGSGSLSTFKTGGIQEETLISSCVDNIIRDTSGYPTRVYTIDFGTDECVGADGKIRKGKIIVTYTGRYRDAGTVINITFDNYSVNNNMIKGTKTITNKGANAAGNLAYDIHVDGNIVRANNEGTVTWTSDRVREWTAGQSTAEWRDDIYSITGTASGTNVKGVSYTANIVTPIVKKLEVGCRYPISGVLDITPSGKPVRRIDYGDGTCDNKATVTVNGNVFNVTLSH